MSKNDAILLTALQSGATFAEPKKFLLFDLTFFSTFVTTARAVWRILVYFFFANRQFFLKFSKIWKKIDYEAFFMHISL